MFSKLATAMLMVLSTCMFSTSISANDGVENKLFISRIKDPNTNVFLSRSLLSFIEGGTLIVSDSDQQGEDTFAPFGTQHGYWEQVNDSAVKIKTVDFNYPKYFTRDWNTGFPGKQTIAVLTGTLNKTGANKYEGDVSLLIFRLRENNIDDPSNAIAGPFVSHLTMEPIAKP